MKASRVAWVDVAKGIGILVVVLGHTLGGILDSPAGRNFSAGRDLFLAIYLFHMPLFFLLAGLFVEPRLERGRRRFASDLMVGLAYPYFLWSTLQYSAIYLAGSLVNRPVDRFWPVLAHLPIVSISQFWFLYVLFVLHVAALLLVPRIGARWFLGLFAAAKLALPLIVLPTMLRLAVVHGLFYALGVALGTAGAGRIGRFLADRPTRLWSMVAAAIVLIGVATSLVIAAHPTFQATRSWQIAAFAWRLPLVSVALVAVAACLGVAAAIEGRAAAWLSYLGRRTMTIYVLHILVIAGLRILLTRIGVHPGAAGLLLILAAAGLLAPLAAYEALRRIVPPRLVGLG